MDILPYTALLLHRQRQCENLFLYFNVVLGGRFAGVRLSPFVCR